MADIKLPNEKKKNYPGLISLCCAIAGFVVGIFFSNYYSVYQHSLFLDKSALKISEVCFLLFILINFIGLCCWLAAVVLFLAFRKKRYNSTGTIAGFILPFLIAGFVMPSLGRMHSPFYYRISDPAAVQYLQEKLKDHEVIGPSFMLFMYDRMYSVDENKNAIKVEYVIRPDLKFDDMKAKYNLRPELKHDDFPKSFSVIIDGKTRNTEVLSENEAQQKTKELNEDSGKFITRPERPK